MNRLAIIGCLSVTLALAAGAQADVSASYLGSFKLGTEAGYYGDSLVVLPDGFSREAGAAVSGPTILTVGQHNAGDDVVEWSIPTLSTTSGGLVTAGVVAAGSNGTSITNTNDWLQYNFASLTEFNGQIWGQNGSLVNNWSEQLVSVGAGVTEAWTGSSGGSSSDHEFANTTVLPFTTNGSHTGFGIAPKRDEANILLAMRSDGSNNNYVLRGEWDSNTSSFINQSQVFNFAATARDFNLEYVDIGGNWYYIVAQEEQQALTLMLFDASTSGSGATPDYTFTVTDDIADGAGWYYSASKIQDLAWDDANDVLYVLDTSSGGGSKGGHVHAFSFAFVPEPATMSLLALGGLMGLTGLLRRRRCR